MRQVAELIETAFGKGLDRAGRRMLGWMRTLGRAGWLGWLMGYWLLPPASRPRGFVWENQGRIVGNASLLPVEGFSDRWVLANVAVHPDSRREGIARSLILACLDWMEQRKNRILLLQVEHESMPARRLYSSLGFKTLTTRTTWVRLSKRNPPPEPHASEVRGRDPSEWRTQWELAKRLHPEGVIWPYPTVASLFLPRGIGPFRWWDNRRHWLWEHEHRVQASLTARLSREAMIWDLIMLVEPEFWRCAERGLLSHALASPVLRYRTTRVDYPHDVAKHVLKDLGFEPRRTLTWMAKEWDREGRSR
jgi:GNAT superfamily N-acetyltransferase